MKKILLVGYMGSGKTVTAKLLAEHLNILAVDLDEVIESEFGLSIKVLFETKGELFFRKQEHAALVRLLQTNEPMVISLGGGTPCYANNHLLLNGSDVVSVYLKASIDTLIERLEGTAGRPLMDHINETERQEFIAKHLFERSYFYNQATHTVQIEGKSPAELAAEIMRLLA